MMACHFTANSNAGRFPQQTERLSQHFEKVSEMPYHSNLGRFAATRVFCNKKRVPYGDFIRIPHGEV